MINTNATLAEPVTDEHEDSGEDDAVVERRGLYDDNSQVGGYCVSVTPRGTVCRARKRRLTQILSLWCSQRNQQKNDCVANYPGR